jgi:hypothetical protein
MPEKANVGCKRRIHFEVTGLESLIPLGGAPVHTNRLSCTPFRKLREFSTSKSALSRCAGQMDPLAIAKT